MASLIARVVAIAAFVAVAPSIVGCRAMQAAAARDPLRCERDPECSHLGKPYDCPSQCVDDIECIKRCEQVRGHR